MGKKELDTKLLTMGILGWMQQWKGSMRGVALWETKSKAIDGYDKDEDYV